MRIASEPSAAVVEVGGTVVVFGDRTGGVSVPPYGSRNVGDHVGDAPDAVIENRRRFARVAFGSGAPDPTDPTAWTWPRQVHGTAVHVVAATTASAAPATTPPTADGVVTTVPGHAVAVVTADCAPVALLTDDVVGIVHAGHRGLLAGVVERAVEAVRARTKAPILAVVGPCIRAARYEFGVEDLQPLVARFGTDAAATTERGRPALDLLVCLRRALHDVGVSSLDDVGICTSASADHFSHRRDGRTGRQASVAMVRP